MVTVETDRLVIRHPAETDRNRFVELFGDEEFMVFSGGDGEMLCLMHPDNRPSRRVADKVGFQWWQRIDWDGDPAEPTDLLRRPIGGGGPPLLLPAVD